MKVTEAVAEASKALIGHDPLAEQMYLEIMHSFRADGYQKYIGIRAALFSLEKLIENSEDFEGRDTFWNMKESFDHNWNTMYRMLKDGSN